jgi:hypothetical protein
MWCGIGWYWALEQGTELGQVHKASNNIYGNGGKMV